jgi:hypothetical protein
MNASSTMSNKVHLSEFMGQTDEKARLDSRTCSHVEEARTQKKASGRNRPKIEADRGGNTAKGF